MYCRYHEDKMERLQVAGEKAVGKVEIFVDGELYKVFLWEGTTDLYHRLGNITRNAYLAQRKEPDAEIIINYKSHCKVIVPDKMGGYTTEVMKPRPFPPPNIDDVPALLEAKNREEEEAERKREELQRELERKRQEKAALEKEKQLQKQRKELKSQLQNWSKELSETDWGKEIYPALEPIFCTDTLFEELNDERHSSPLARNFIWETIEALMPLLTQVKELSQSTNYLPPFLSQNEKGAIKKILQVAKRSGGKQVLDVTKSVFTNPATQPDDRQRHRFSYKNRPWVRQIVNTFILIMPEVEEFQWVEDYIELLSFAKKERKYIKNRLKTEFQQRI